MVMMIVVDLLPMTELLFHLDAIQLRVLCTCGRVVFGLLPLSSFAGDFNWWSISVVLYARMAR